MGKAFKITLWFFLILVFVIQLIPYQLPESIEINSDDLIRTGDLPENISKIIRTSCYDCHSNETNYPWYSYVAPVKWLVAKDTRHGREDLNFSNWNSLKAKDKIKILQEISEEIESEAMPMPIYTLMHSKAKMDKEKRDELITWTEQMTDQIFGE